MRKFLPFAILSILTAFGSILSSCGIRPPFEQTATLTPISTFTPICPQETIYPFGETGFSPQLVVAIFEDNPSYHAYALQGVNILNNALKDTVEPGDYVIMLRMEPLTLEDATFVRSRVNNLPFPLFQPPPTDLPTDIATNIPNTPQTELGGILATKIEATTMASLHTTATQITLLHNCAIDDWKTRNINLQKKWIDEKQNNINQFMQSVINQEIALKEDKPIARTAVWNSLVYATKIFNNECSNFSRCVLIVFSDMRENNTNPSGLVINLSNTEFLGVMLDCQFVYSGQCGYWSNFWKKSLNTRSDPDFINSENVSEAVKAFLHR